MQSISARVILAAIITSGLAACGGGSSEGGNPDPQPENNQQVLTTPSSTEDFVEQYKSVLKQSASVQKADYTGLVDGRTLSNEVDAPEANDSLAGTGDDVSGTNTILADVDESDFVKYDGRYLYSYQTGPDVGIEWQNRLSVIDTQPAEPSVLTSVDLGDSNLIGFYMRELDAGGDENKQIIAVSTDYTYFAFTDIWPGSVTAKTKVSLVNGLPTSPEITETLTIDGSLLASRMIEDRLVLVTGHMPDIVVEPEPVDDEQEGQNFAAIDALTAADIMPAYRKSGGELSALIDSSNCFVLQDEAPLYGAPQILTITTIDLDDTSSVNSVCTTSFASAFFISQQSIYLTDYTDDGGTLIHKFALSDSSVSYRGTGEVKGYIRGGEYSFHLYEQNDTLYALSTTWSEEDFEHRFTVLREDATEENRLTAIAQLPNDNQPQAIGKPGEDIFGVRFFNDTAFVVTFEQIDPLYAIDISDPTAPAIVGELELPGVSEYLHPISDDLLLGVGHNGQWPREMQVNLFDISDKTQPSLITQEKFTDYQGAWTSLDYDHHAFASVLNGDEQWAKAAFPFSVYPHFSDDGVVVDPETGVVDPVTGDDGTETDGETASGSDENPTTIDGIVLADSPEPVDSLELVDSTELVDSPELIDSPLVGTSEPAASPEPTNSDFAPWEEKNYVVLLDIDKTNKLLSTPRVKEIEVEEPYSYYQRIIIDGDDVIFVSNSKAEKFGWE